MRAIATSLDGYTARLAGWMGEDGMLNVECAMLNVEWPARFVTFNIQHCTFNIPLLTTENVPSPRTRTVHPPAVPPPRCCAPSDDGRCPARARCSRCRCAAGRCRGGAR